MFHPAYAGVSLALLHGSQPDVIVVCHQPGRERVLGHPDYALPRLPETIAFNIEFGRRTNPMIRCGGVSLNTYGMRDRDARYLLASEARRLQLPVADPIVRVPSSMSRSTTACRQDSAIRGAGGIHSLAVHCRIGLRHRWSSQPFVDSR